MTTKEVAAKVPKKNTMLSIMRPLVMKVSNYLSFGLLSPESSIPPILSMIGDNIDSVTFYWKINSLNCYPQAW